MSLTAVLGGWSRSFEFRDFRLLWWAVLIQSASMGMNWVVSGWLIFEITESAFMVGVASALGMAPFFFLGPLSGAAADRLDRRRLLCVVSLAGAAAAGVMAAALAADVAELWHIMVLIAVGGAAMAFKLTTRQSLTYDIVGQGLALNGMALNSVAMQIGMMIGSLISGVIIASVGASGQYLVIGLLYLASVLFFLTIRVTRSASKPGRRESVSRNLFQYVRIMRHNRTLVVLMSLAAVMELFGFTHMSLLPVLAKDVLGLGPVGLGVMTGVRQIGGIAGLLALSAHADFRRRGLLLFVVMTTFGLSLMSLVLSTNIVYYVAALTIAHACAMCGDTLQMTLMQDNVRDDERGRAMGAWTLSIGVAPVGHLGLGALAGNIGAPRALLASGTTLLVMSLAAAVSLPKIRRLE